MPIISLSNDNPVPVLSNTTEVEVAQEALQSAINTIEPADIFDITSATTGTVIRFNGVDLVVAQLNTSDLNNDSNFVAQGDNVSALNNDSNYISQGDNISELNNDSNYITNTDDVVLQSYATADLPATPATGTMVFDTDTTSVKVYNGTAWAAL